MRHLGTNPNVDECIGDLSLKEIPTLEVGCPYAVHGYFLGLGRYFSCHAWHVPTCRTPLGEGGGGKAQRGGVSPTRRAAERSDFSQKNYGETSCAAPGQRPQRGLVSSFACVSTPYFRVGVAGRTRGCYETLGWKIFVVQPLSRRRTRSRSRETRFLLLTAAHIARSLKKGAHRVNAPFL